MDATKYLGKKDYFVYGISNFFGSSIAGLTQGYLLIFYTTILKINPLIVGTMFLISKIWDGVNDPIEGSIIDRTKSKYGKLRPYLIYGALPYAAMTILLFLPVRFSDTLNIVYMYVTYFIWCTLYTFVDAPLQALPSVVSPNNGERTKMISFGRMCGSAGGEMAMVLISLCFLIFKNASTVYLVTAVILSVCGAASLISGGFRIKENIPALPVETHSVFEGFRYLGRNKPLLLLITGNFLSFFRNIISASVVYVLTYIFLQPQKQLLFAIPAAIGSFVGMICPPIFIKKISGKMQFILATLFLSAVMTCIYIAGLINMNLYLIAALMFFSGIPTGILNVVPTLMCADTLDYMHWKEGTRQEGITFSLMSFRSKVASGFKDFTITLILAWIGFSAVGNGVPIPGRADLFQQTEAAKHGLFLMFTMIPAVFNLLSIIPFLFYKLDGKLLERVRQELACKQTVNEQSTSPTFDIYL